MAFLLKFSKLSKLFFQIVFAITIFLPNSAQAADTLSRGNTAWIITATALVLFMTMPGLALFYGGLVRSKNFLSVLMQCFTICCLASIVWVVAGYSIAFGSNNIWWGGLSKSFLSGSDIST